MAKRKEPNESNGDRNKRDQFTVEQRPKKYGPVHKRSCTDVICLFLFAAILGVWGYMILFFYRYVDLERTLHPSDPYGNVCGKGNFTDRPYLAFFNLFTCAVKFESTIIDGCPTPQVCVERCPNITFSINRLTGTSDSIRALQAANAICMYNVKPTPDTIIQLVEKGQCAELYFNSDPIGGRCLPSVVKIVNGAIQNEITNSALQGPNGEIDPQQMIKNNKIIANLMKALALGTKIANDIAKTWQWILIGLVGAMIVAFFWIFLMQFIARYMIWFSIVAIFFVTTAGLYFSATEYLRLNSSNGGDIEKVNASLASFYSGNMPRAEMQQSLKYIRAEDPNGLSFDLDLSGKLQDQLESYRNNPTTWLVLCCILGALLLIFSLLFCCLFRRIDLAVRVIEEASKAVNNMKSTLFFPIVPYIFKIIIITGWMFAVIIIAAGTHKQFRDANDKFCVPEILKPEHTTHLKLRAGESHHTDPNCTFKGIFERKYVYGAHAFNIFILIWVLFFVMGCCYITLSGAFATYYWTFKKAEVPFFALLGSGYRCIRYHLGSVAFGSLLVAIVRFIRVILTYIDEKCKKYSNNAVAKAIMCCMKCCFWCLENFIKFINKNAYIMIAIYGKNFCASAKDGFFLLASNGLRSLVLSFLSGFLIFLSKIAVTGLIGVGGFFVLTNRAEYLVRFDDLNFYWAPLALFVILSYIVTSSFFNVYDVAIETIFMCYLEDRHRNDGSKERPYYMSSNLLKVMGGQKR